MPRLAIRRATPADADVVAELVFSLLDELSGGKAPEKDEVLRRTRIVLDSDRVTALLAIEEDVPIGVITLNDCMAIYAGGPFGQISEFYVAPDKRSQGVAPQLLRAAKDEGRTREWTRLEVGAPSQPKWSRSLAFYLANGFEEVGPRLRISI
ncbi:GNAT family N-acetyltransferase [Pseudooceanicola nanhaiensis]|uniref:GNAT family N-acetyltransferase n=1 Tax=Pseudooceanicola nanhaiensis TaxID=375761 RepID=UPI001CD7CD73|nr:GNAT family N-acetyltransferase [Pseudooceanicola nanhaiensis]MCA0922818.1 GNAT family N-acetyltransferase [Pseudooceanicola nanhaiensis]